MRAAGRLVGEVLSELTGRVAPGVTTAELDEIAEELIRQAGAVPAFKGYHGYPATICASINEEVIHGIPNGTRVLNEGDVISIDVGASLDGFPRTVKQAAALDDIMSTRDPLIVVDIVVPEAELVRRLGTRLICDSCGAGAPVAGLAAAACVKCGGRLVQRADDNQAVVIERLKVYHRMSEPLVEYYRVRPTFRSIDGAQPPERVAADLAAAIAAAGNGAAGARG